MINATQLGISPTVQRATALLVIVSVTAAIGLAAFEVSDIDAGTRSLPTDANAGRAPGTPVPALPAAPQGSGVLDPALFRLDDSGAHHG